MAFTTPAFFTDNGDLPSIQLQSCKSSMLVRWMTYEKPDWLFDWLTGFSIAFPSVGIKTYELVLAWQWCYNLNIYACLCCLLKFILIDSYSLYLDLSVLNLNDIMTKLSIYYFVLGCLIIHACIKLQTSFTNTLFSLKFLIHKLDCPLINSFILLSIYSICIRLIIQFSKIMMQQFKYSHACLGCQLIHSYIHWQTR